VIVLAEPAGVRPGDLARAVDALQVRGQESDVGRPPWPRCGMGMSFFPLSVHGVVLIFCLRSS
jgi:hypothetical protein